MKNTRAVRELELRTPITVDPFGSFRKTGSKIDDTFSPSFLYGTPSKPGLLFKMRYEHPLIKSYMDAKRDAMADLSFGFEPKDDSYESLYAAYLFTKEFENLAVGDLSSWVADTYDYLGTYGHILWKFMITDTQQLRMIPIEAQQIESWDMDEFGTDLKQFRLWATGTVLEADKHNFAWVGRKRLIDDYRGASDLRALADLFAVYMEDMSAYVSERRLHKGILYIQPIPGETPGEDAWNSAADWLVAYYQGRPYAPILPPGFDLKHLQASSPAIMVVPEMIRLQEDSIAKALKQNINSMTSGGSYALGKEVSSEDREQGSNHIDFFLRVLNGDFDPVSKVFERLCTVYGINPRHCPRLVALDNTDLRTTEMVDTLTELVDAGIMTPQDITAESRVQIMDEIGLDSSEVAEESDMEQ